MVTRLGYAASWLLALAALPHGPVSAAEPMRPEGSRIAAISGVHDPHQGFALSATVPSDRMCLELAQNLASELGIVVHVVCTDPRDGATTIVAECGYATSIDAAEVASYSRGWGRSGDPLLLCVPPDADRFRARRIPPNVDALRPRPSARR